MSKKSFPYQLYLVTDEKACFGRNLIDVTEEAVKGGVDIVQLREKELSHEDFLAKALRMKEMLDRYHVPLIINDNLWVARLCDAAGVHVGNSDIAPYLIRNEWPGERIIGYSIEEQYQVNSESAYHSDYLGISPVFSTPTKIDTVTEWGLQGVTTIRSLTSKPLVAIGGIKIENANSVIAAGADCLAVVSAICSAENPALTSQQFRVEIKKSN